MDTKYTKNVAAVLLALFLIVLGVYYLMKQKTDTVENIDGEVSITDENDTSVVVEGGEVVAKDDSSVQKIQDFNKAMNNAQIAFGKGEYDKSIAYYNEALNYLKSDKVYSGLFLSYSALNNVDKARVALDAAIKLNPKYTDYWKWQLSLLDDKTGVSYADLKRVYEDGIAKVDSKTKINLITHFALISETNFQKTEAISLWEYAKRINPSKTAVYQVEIDRLKAN